MQSNSELAEMVNSTNYAAMSYGELVTLNFAFLLALGEIKPLMGVKRAEEMQALTDEYVAKMNPYGASKAEILACLEKEALRDEPFGPLASQNVDDQTPTTNVENNQDKGEDTLALPESAHPSTSEVERETSMERPAGENQNDDDATDSRAEESVSRKQEDGKVQAETIPTCQESGEGTLPQSLVKKAIETAIARPVPKDIDVNAPYFLSTSFDYNENGDLKHNSTQRRNLSADDLDSFRSASEKYVRLFLKKEVMVSTDDSLVYFDGKNTISVIIYHFPDVEGEGEICVSNPDVDGGNISAEDAKELKRKYSLLKKAIKRVSKNPVSTEADPNTFYYDRCTFRCDGTNVNRSSDNKRFYTEDVKTLTEIMTAFETYVRFFK